VQVFFYIGMIDVLQRWTLKKRLERLAKFLLRCVERAGLSAMEPVAYQRRFSERVIDMVVREPSRDDSSLELGPSPVPASSREQSRTLN
jgi:1-phosphatidylinositol-4-phosphate 5-kinase